MSDCRLPFLLLTAVVFGAAAGRPVQAAGFELPYQAGKAAAMAGAFVAQADDPSAIFYNPGGVALLADKPAVTAGLSLYTISQSLYQGLAPGVGAGTTGEQESQTTPLPHVYWVKELTDNLKIGLGVSSPFLWQTGWKDKDGFSGRAIALGFEVRTFDFAPTAALKLSPKLGIGVSLLYRLSDVTYSRRLQIEDPSSGAVVDYAARDLSTPMTGGFGFNAGLLYRRKHFSLGASVRNPIRIDYSGTRTLTQIPTGNETLDALLAAATPFDQALGVLTSLEFPGQLTVGVAAQVTEALTIEADLVETGWSSVAQLVFDFPANPSFDETLPLDLSDTTSLRVGFRFRNKSGTEYRAGFSLEETPQPSPTVGPLLLDADRQVFTVGIGKDWLDVSWVWIDFGQRRVADSIQEFNGNYSGNSWLLAITVSQ